MTTHTMLNVKLTSVEGAFRPAGQARERLDGLLRQDLALLQAHLLRPGTDLLPQLDDIRRETWKGAQPLVREELERFRQQAENCEREILKRAMEELTRERLEEQRGGAVRRSSLYQAITEAFQGQPAPGEWKDELETLLADLRPAEERFRKALRGRLPLGRGRAYDTLVVMTQTVLNRGRDMVGERCQRLLNVAIRDEIANRQHRMDQSRKLLESLCADEKHLERANVLGHTAIAQGRSSANHHTSITPKPSIIEALVRQRVPFMAEDGLHVEQFGHHFGAWASAQGRLPAEEPETFVVEIQRFLAEQGRSALAGVDLVGLYAKTGTTPPLQALMQLSDVPIDLIALAAMDGVLAKAVRVIQVPDGLPPTAGLDGSWTRVPGADANRIVMVQDVQGISARAFLDVPGEWQQALSDRDGVLKETSTPLLHEAAIETRVVERFAGAAAQRVGASAGASAPPSVPPVPPLADKDAESVQPNPDGHQDVLLAG